MKTPQKVHIKSYGCQMNVYDAERMVDVLSPIGYLATNTVEDADLVILNTCHIREKASEKVYSELGRLRVLQEKNRKNGRSLMIAVAGCVAQAEGEEIISRAPFVDMVFGPQAYHKLPEMIAHVSRKAGKPLETEFDTQLKFDQLPKQQSAQGTQAFLTIQEGCDKFCTFCVVPYTRGAEFSRPMHDVMQEARHLVGAGVAEITLLGQNVNAYHGAEKDETAIGLGRLIAELETIDGLERIRYTTSYPAEVDDQLIAAHRDIKALMPFLHLPVQSGSDTILKAMNRRHNAAEYRDLVKRLRVARPDLALSSDFIVGFPGETEADFEATMDLIKDVKYTQAYSFKYSPRPGTPAALMPMQVDDAVKSERLARLQDLINSQQKAFNESCIGAKMPVLLDRVGRHDGQLVGRSPYMQAVHVVADDQWMGKIVNVDITNAHANSLSGALSVDLDRNDLDERVRA